jgi:hypothetical protein
LGFSAAAVVVATPVLFAMIYAIPEDSARDVQGPRAFEAMWAAFRARLHIPHAAP